MHRDLTSHGELRLFHGRLTILHQQSVTSVLGLYVVLVRHLGFKIWVPEVTYSVTCLLNILTYYYSSSYKAKSHLYSTLLFSIFGLRVRLYHYRLQ